MIQVKNNEIIAYSLPKTGTLSTGETVSGYNLLPKATLKEEGWLSLDDKKPEYNPDTHYLVDDGYEILKTKVNKLYKVVEIPEPEQPEEPLNQAQFRSMAYAVQKLVRVDELSEEEYENIINLYSPWEMFVGQTIVEGTIVRYEGVLYKVVEGQTHKVEEHLDPVSMNYGYGKITPKGVIEEWEQRDYTNKYEVGEKVLWEGKVYELIEGGNAYSYNPTAYPQGWKEV